MSDRQIEQDRGKWDHNNEVPIVPTCNHCGSSGVTRDAVVRWDIEKQVWELSGIFDNSDCDVCGEARLEDTPVEGWLGEEPDAQEVSKGHFVSAEMDEEHGWRGIITKDGQEVWRSPESEGWHDPLAAKDAARMWLFEQGML